MPPTKNSAPTLERSIHFYRADLGSKNGVPIPLELKNVLKTVETLPFAAGSKRYLDEANGDALSIWFGSSTPTELDRFSFASVRRNGLPRAELNGMLSNLPLTAGQGLHEATNVRLFADNIVGVEFNYYAPRVSRLSEYLSSATGAPGFTLDPLLRQDVLEELKKRKEIRVLELQIKSSYASIVEQASKSLGKALRAVHDASNAEVVGIVMRPTKYGHSPLSKKVVQATKTIAKRSDLRDNVVRFAVKGVNTTTGHVDTLDLLQDQLIMKKSILAVGGKSRAVKPESAWDAIGQAYSDLQSELAAASAAALAP